MWNRVPETNDSEREILMSRPAAAASLPLPFELVVDDGIPMDNDLHVLQASLLRESVIRVMKERGRDDFFAAGNVFVYYSVEQARHVAEGGSYFRGPDFFFVQGVPPRHRTAWVSWEEGGRLPDLIVELLSPSTESIDRNEKAELYASVFRTPEYYLYKMETGELEGLRLVRGSYRPMVRNARGRFESKVLGLELGLRHGTHKMQEAAWLRLFTPDGRLVLSNEEAEEQALSRAEAERQRAEAERQRADAAEAELKRLRALLDER
jgi:Uma2 family endonuclease